MSTTTIPADAILATTPRGELAALCDQHGVTRLQGDGPSMMRRALAAARDGKPLAGRPLTCPIAAPSKPQTPPAAPSKQTATPPAKPVRDAAAKDAKSSGVQPTQKPAAPQAAEGEVSRPVQDGQGVVKVFVMCQTAAGAVYQAATVGQLVTALFAGVKTHQERQAVLDMVSAADDAARERLNMAAAKKVLANKPQTTPPAESKPQTPPASEIPASPADVAGSAPPLPVNPDALHVVVPVQQKEPERKPAPITPPATYKGLTKLGKDGVVQLARQYGIATDGSWTDTLKAVWGHIKPAAAGKGEEKKTATPPAAPKAEKAAAQTAKPDTQPATYAAGTMLIADGKGGVRPATEAELWAALERFAKKAS